MVEMPDGSVIMPSHSAFEHMRDVLHQELLGATHKLVASCHLTALNEVSESLAEIAGDPTFDHVDGLSFFADLFANGLRLIRFYKTDFFQCGNEQKGLAVFAF